MANQRDVARHAGVSSATVSRYLNNPVQVSDRVAKAIDSAIATLDYHVDFSAQTLKTGKSRQIGVIMPGIGAYHWTIYQGLQETCNREGYSCTIFYPQNHQAKARNHDRGILPIMRGKQIDGAIYLPLCTAADDQTIEQLQGWGRPFVVLDRPLGNQNISQVYTNNYEAGRYAAREFLSRGHREFIFIWGLQDFSSSRERFNGFRDELSLKRIELPSERQIAGEFVSSICYRNACEAWHRLPPFTAVFGSNDSSAYGFLKAAREHGVDCPKDFSLIGFDDDPDLSLLLTPPLASFAQPAEKLGHTGARLLLDHIAGKESTPLQIGLEAKFIERGSLVQLK